uniref:Endonuclease/exonuclease/phosphatase domain-containing protein n=1 Tax=Glossina austeni TaxID=7395 RepID=A0A1A9VQG1_GLOAU
MPLELDVDGCNGKLNLEALTSVTLDNETIPVIEGDSMRPEFQGTSIPQLIRTGYNGDVVTDCCGDDESKKTKSIIENKMSKAYEIIVPNKLNPRFKLTDISLIMVALDVILISYENIILCGDFNADLQVNHSRSNEWPDSISTRGLKWFELLTHTKCHALMTI